MNWKAILNPWGEARRLRERVAYLEGQIEQVELFLTLGVKPVAEIGWLKRKTHT